MKSPVFGRGRNWYHRPRGSHFSPSAANVNLKGKKFKPMSCGCCSCIDFRQDIIRKQHMKEIRNVGRED